MSFGPDLKIIIVGTSGTGKTSLFKKYTGRKFSDIYKPSVSSEFYSKNFKYKGKLYKIQMWDVICQKKYASLIKIFSKGSHGCIFLSDATNLQTREDILEWKKSVDKEAVFLDGGKLPSIIVESKCDLIKENQKKNFKKELNEFAEKNEFYGAFLASSKTGENVNKSFHFLLKIIIKRMDDIVSKGKEDFFF